MVMMQVFAKEELLDVGGPGNQATRDFVRIEALEKGDPKNDRQAYRVSVATTTAWRDTHSRKRQLWILRKLPC